MQLRFKDGLCRRLFFLLVAGTLLLPNANAVSCKTGSQMTAAERDALSSTARTLAGDVQSGDTQALRNNTLPAVAADFGGIAASANNLKPLMQQATITVEELYLLDASDQSAGAARTDFYCGTRIVTIDIPNLPSGKYALAILHATGVPQPQQLSLILSENAENRWMLAGFFSNRMIEAGHDGLWYWQQAREYAQKKMDWNAWFYYQTAAALLQPAPFLSSPNFEKLQQEADRARPANLPAATRPVMLDVQGSPVELTTINITEAFGGFDLEVHYIPSTAQLAQLHDPVAARKQAIAIMTALLVQHPELRSGFRGVWVRADQNGGSIYALDLPMAQIASTTPTPAATSNPATR